MTRELRRSTYTVRAPICLIDETAGAFLAIDNDDMVKDYELQRSAADPIAFSSTKNDPDTLHYGEAMRADDAQEFKKAVQMEANAHTSRGHWIFMKKEDVPANHSVLPSIWAFRRK